MRKQCPVETRGGGFSGWLPGLSVPTGARGVNTGPGKQLSGLALECKLLNMLILQTELSRIQPNISLC